LVLQLYHGSGFRLLVFGSKPTYVTGNSPLDQTNHASMASTSPEKKRKNASFGNANSAVCALCQVCCEASNIINIPTSWFDMQLDMYFDLNDENMIWQSYCDLQLVSFSVLVSGRVRFFCSVLEHCARYTATRRCVMRWKLFRNSRGACAKLARNVLSQQLSLCQLTMWSHLPMYFDRLYSIVMYSASWWFLQSKGSEQIFL